MITETNTTVFIPTDGPRKGREIVEHVNTPTHALVAGRAELPIGHYVLDHAAGIATWEPGKFYDEAIHG